MACHCGHAIEEHRSGRFGPVECEVDGCDCCHYDEADEDDSDEGDAPDAR